MYMLHNHHFLSFACMMEGRRERALSSARAMLAAIPPEMLEHTAALADPFMSIEYDADAADTVTRRFQTAWERADTHTLARPVCVFRKHNKPAEPGSGKVLDPNIGRAIAAWKTNLMRPCRPPGFLAKIYEKPVIKFESAAFRVAFNLCHPGTSLGHFGIELIVPDTVPGTGHVEPPAIVTQLQHLRPPRRVPTGQIRRLSDHSAEPDLACEFGFRRIGHVVLANTRSHN